MHRRPGNDHPGCRLRTAPQRDAHRPHRGPRLLRLRPSLEEVGLRRCLGRLGSPWNGRGTRNDHARFVGGWPRVRRRRAFARLLREPWHRHPKLQPVAAAGRGCRLLRHLLLRSLLRPPSCDQLLLPTAADQRGAASPRRGGARRGGLLPHRPRDEEAFHGPWRHVGEPPRRKEGMVGGKGLLPMEPSCSRSASSCGPLSSYSMLFFASSFLLSSLPPCLAAALRCCKMATETGWPPILLGCSEGGGVEYSAKKAVRSDSKSKVSSAA
mmetsp:Transcript_90758/g.189722  ORF Transcript_90758/g.189722 Transcript_90758/m.189722 type:complete len:268 (+) Transcript_90758:1133-1936(+)